VQPEGLGKFKNSPHIEINVEKPKYTLLSRHQNIGRNRDIKISSSSFGNVSEFKYLGTTVTN
jgi:hypothetical protein